MESSRSQAKSTNPYTGETVSEQKFLSEDEINQRIQTSWTSFLNYRRTDIKYRSERLNRLAEMLEKNLDKLSKTITMETGKPIMQSRKEVRKTIKVVRYYVQHMEEFTRPTELKLENAKRSYVCYEPLGPIYHMSSYNYPLFQDVRRAVPALLMGNTVLNRSSNLTPSVGMLVEQLYRDAGFNNGEYLNLITPHEQSEMIIRHPSVRGVSYIGSVSAGQCIGSLAGKYTKKFVSEQGSNDAFIVMNDADLDWAVDRATESRLKDSGQSSIAAKSFFIDDSVFDTFRNKLIGRLQSVQMGDPMDQKTMLGPLSNTSDLQKSVDQIKRAKDQGAKLLYGGEQPRGDGFKSGLFLTPTVFEVSEGSVLLNEETFAPIFALVRFRDDKDIIRLTNSRVYGFNASIFTKDETKAERLVPELEVGDVFINFYAHYNAGLPMKATKSSGIGCEGGVWGTREFCNIKGVFVSDMSKTIGSR